MKKELRSQFSVFILMPNMDENTEIKASLVQMGYEAFVFAEQDTLVARIKEAAPHMIVFSPEALMTPLSDFVERVLNENPEVNFICAAPVSQMDTLQEYAEYNFAEVVILGERLPLRLCQAVDRLAQTLYLTYVNEKLFSESKKIKSEESVKNAEISKLSQVSEGLRDLSVTSHLVRYQQATSQEDLIQSFMNSLDGVSSIYFKFLPTVNSFVATLSRGVDIDTVKGAGSRLSEEEARDVHEFLGAGKVPAALSALMQEGLKIVKYVSQPVLVHKSIDGLFIFWKDESFEFSLIENSFQIFQLVYQNAYLVKRSEVLDIFDGVTDLHNRNFYYKKLDEEISRARRLEKPVSVVKIGLDNYIEMEQSLGKNNRDMILRSVASIVKKTSRVNDFSCRTQDNEMAMILPHCSRKGGALRAERLRRIVENHSFAINGIKVTISCGVSEYPSLCTGSAELDNSATQSLEFISERGGNKVCLFKPTQTFKPDFDVPTA